jgi:hypothetical protein
MNTQHSNFHIPGYNVTSVMYSKYMVIIKGFIFSCISSDLRYTVVMAVASEKPLSRPTIYLHNLDLLPIITKVIVPITDLHR